MAFAGREIVVAEFDAGVLIVLVEIERLAQFLDHLRKTLETFVSLRQAPMSRGHVAVDLNSVAKLEGSFLKLLLF